LEFVELCRKLIALDTTPTHGNIEAVHFLADVARAQGLDVDIQDEVAKQVSQANLLIRLPGPRASHELMLQTRLDTPDPGPFALWTKTGLNPFDAHIIDGEIFGLGAADCKLDVICKLRALFRFQEVNGGKAGGLPPVLVFTFGEESGMTGALKLIRKNKMNAKFAVIGEPSDLQILTAGSGFAHVAIQLPFEDDEANYRSDHNLRENSSTISKTFSGKSAHSANPERGESAVIKMLEYLSQLPEDLAIMEIDGGVNLNTIPAQAFLEIDPFSGFRLPMAKKLNHVFAAVQRLESEFLFHRDLDFSPPHPTLNLGSVRTQDYGIEISGTVRIPPGITNEIYETWMKAFRIDCQRVGADFRVSDYKRPYRTDPQGNFVRMIKTLAKDQGLRTDTGTHSSTNEASLFHRVGIECISLGPGVREGNIHTPTEHVKLEDLRKAEEFYFGLMTRMCL
jgi:acetylornithine deacetylase/succinyl-diaminopimelate desuccinylase-like protein